MTPICSEYVLDGKMRPYLDTIEMVKYMMSNIGRIIMVIQCSCTWCQRGSGLDSAYVALSNPERRCPKDHLIHIYQSVCGHLQNVSSRACIYVPGMVDSIHKGIS